MEDKDDQDLRAWLQQESQLVDGADSGSCWKRVETINYGCQEGTFNWPELLAVPGAWYEVQVQWKALYRVQDETKESVRRKSFDGSIEPVTLVIGRELPPNVNVPRGLIDGAVKSFSRSGERAKFCVEDGSVHIFF